MSDTKPNGGYTDDELEIIVEELRACASDSNDGESDHGLMHDAADAIQELRHRRDGALFVLHHDDAQNRVPVAIRVLEGSEPPSRCGGSRALMELLLAEVERTSVHSHIVTDFDGRKAWNGYMICDYCGGRGRPEIGVSHLTDCLIYRTRKALASGAPHTNGGAPAYEPPPAPGSRVVTLRELEEIIERGDDAYEVVVLPSGEIRANLRPEAERKPTTLDNDVGAEYGAPPARGG